MGREDCIDLTSFFEQVMAKLDKLNEERQKTINHAEKQQKDKQAPNALNLPCSTDRTES